ncbi:hypothetical protein CYCD_04040 [Tenuifilaceae bacterium CYCD]|nr:hypothetical protein CYCD_04040 [Tenuifilaceae bacterium CYCD]
MEYVFDIIENRKASDFSEAFRTRGGTLIYYTSFYLYIFIYLFFCVLQFAYLEYITHFTTFDKLLAPI